MSSKLIQVLPYKILIRCTLLLRYSFWNHAAIISKIHSKLLSEIVEIHDDVDLSKADVLLDMMEHEHICCDTDFVFRF